MKKNCSSSFFVIFTCTFFFVKTRSAGRKYHPVHNKSGVWIRDQGTEGIKPLPNVQLDTLDISIHTEWEEFNTKWGVTLTRSNLGPRFNPMIILSRYYVVIFLFLKKKKKDYIKLKMIRSLYKAWYEPFSLSIH